MDSLEQSYEKKLKSDWTDLRKQVFSILNLQNLKSTKLPDRIPSIDQFTWSTEQRIQIFQALDGFVGKYDWRNTESAVRTYYGEACSAGYVAAAHMIGAEQPILNIAKNRETYNELCRSGFQLVKDNATKSIVNKILPEIEAQALAGTNPRHVASRLKKLFDDKNSDWERLAQTEMTAAAETAKLHEWRQWKVEMVEFVPAPDGCPQCISLAGKYPISKCPIPGTGTHPRCRCSIRPAESEVNIPQPVSELPEASNPPKPRKRKEKDIFPEDISELEIVSSLGGSTGAELVRDPATDRLFVRKAGNSAAHLLEEATADGIYQVLDVRVPRFKIYGGPDKPVKLAEYIEGRPLKEILQSGDKKLIGKVVRQLQKDFAADALQANWDVAGLNYDNILIDKKGKVWRIDNGGALRFRAQGTSKGAAFDEFVTELWSMRDPVTNRKTAEMFGNLKHKDVTKQIETILNKRDLVLESVSDQALKDMLSKRFETLADVAKTSRTFLDDNWVDDYVSGFTKHSVGLRKAGIVESLPKRFTQDLYDPAIVYDEEGRRFDKLRGMESTMAKFKEYVQGNGGKYRFLETWMASQGGNSWSEYSQSLKYYLLTQTEKKAGDFFWSGGVERAKRLFRKNIIDKGLDQFYSESVQAYHAFTHELIRNCEFKYKDIGAKGTVRLMRTEDARVLRRNEVYHGATNATMKRGMAESTSIYRKVSVGGGELTVQDVPYHRIIGTYFTERTPGTAISAFYGDAENEFVAMLHDIPFTYNNNLTSNRLPVY